MYPSKKKKKLCATKPWPSGFIVIPGEESCQDVPIDLSTSQVEMDQDFDEQPSLPENIITPEHSYCKSPQYTADECDVNIQNQIENETQSDLNEDTEQESQIHGHNESLYEVSKNWEYEELNEELEPPVPLIKSGKPFPTHLFDDLQPIEVNSIPKYIDGFKKYIVTTSDLAWRDDTSDSHYFELSASSKRGFSGVRKGEECKGSWVCLNSNCGFLKTSKNKQLNYINWTYLQHNKKEKICSMCHCYAVREQCGARKLVEYDSITHTAVVYHISHHRCHKKLDFQMRCRNIQARTQEFAQMGGSASLAGKMTVGKLIMQGKAHEEKLEMHNWIDIRMTQRIFHEQQETHSVDENSFDAVGIPKRALDEEDKFNNLSHQQWIIKWLI